MEKDRVGVIGLLNADEKLCPFRYTRKGIKGIKEIILRKNETFAKNSMNSLSSIFTNDELVVILHVLIPGTWIQN